MLLALRHFPAGAEGQTYWVHLDGRGSIAGLTKHLGQSTHNYRYDAYGQLLPAQGNWTDPHNPYTFAGKEWDEHLGLYEFGLRLYDPWAGVWLTREPLPGEAGEPRTWHRYQYAYASPISYYDPYGAQVPPGTGVTGGTCALYPCAPAHTDTWPFAHAAGHPGPAACAHAAADTHTNTDGWAGSFFPVDAHRGFSVPRTIYPLARLLDIKCGRRLRI